MSSDNKTSIGSLAVSVLGGLKGPIESLSRSTRKDLARSTGKALKEMVSNIDGEFDDWAVNLGLEFLEDAIREYKSIDLEPEINPFKE